MIRNRNRRRTLPNVEPVERRALMATLTLTSLGDDGVGSGDSGDLRYLINRANALRSTTPDTIVLGFTLTSSNNTIHVGTGAAGNIPLPAITDPLVFNATDSNVAASLLGIDGSALKRGSGANGLVLKGGGSTIAGFQITNFPGNGILITSANNTIGGTTVGTNGLPPTDPNFQRNTPAGKITTDPKNPMTVPRVIIRPPDGNIIGGNGGDGVRISGKAARFNNLYGNFIGTDLSGTHAVPNLGNGVTIVNADNNTVQGTTPPDKDNPFVYYNVISGNRGNGLVVTNSDNTTIYANFFGLGADDATPVGNGGDGVLINGDSTNTRFGGNIPLGNVTAANVKHGVEVADRASRTFAGNTFAGIAAFNSAVQVGNRGDGFRITTDGGKQKFGKSDYSTLILTCQSADNAGNGINITGKAKGVQVSQSIIGLDTNGQAASPNGLDGIAIGGKASNIQIGGFQPSVAGEPPTGTLTEAAGVVSGNAGNGISIVGHGVKGVTIVNTYVGTDILRTGGIANGRNGIFINDADGVRIGSPLGSYNKDDTVTVAYNTGNGILVQDAEGVSILGDSIYSNGRRGIALTGGANDDATAPVLTSVVTDPATGLATVKGRLPDKGHGTYRVELYASPTGVPGTGQTFVAFAKIKSGHKGATFKFAGLALPAGQAFLTATATDDEGNTSAFSKAIS